MKTAKTNKYKQTKKQTNKKPYLSTHKLKTTQTGITFAGTGSLLEAQWDTILKVEW